MRALLADEIDVVSGGFSNARCIATFSLVGAIYGGLVGAGVGFVGGAGFGAIPGSAEGFIFGGGIGSAMGMAVCPP